MAVVFVSKVIACNCNEKNFIAEVPDIFPKFLEQLFNITPLDGCVYNCGNRTF